MKKLTKAEIKEMEKIQAEKNQKRRALVDAVEQYWADASALKRAAEINGEKIDEDAINIKLLDRAPEMKFLQEELLKEYSNDVDRQGKQKHTVYWKMWSWVRILVKSSEESQKCKNSKSIYNNQTGKYDSMNLDILPKDAIWCNDIIWNIQEMKIYLQLCREYGINKIYYTNSSSGALGNISDLIRMGAVIIGTTNINEYKIEEGLIFDISEVNI